MAGARSGITLPYQYLDEFQSDTFEDVTKKNLEYLASSMGGATRMRFLYGIVNGSTGDKVSGSAGWTSAQTGTGVYEVIFDSQFADAPVAVCMGITGVVNGLATPSQLDVSTFNVGGGAANHSFQFLVLF